MGEDCAQALTTRDISLDSFREAAVVHVRDLLGECNRPSIDALTITARRPLRTVVLALLDLVEEGWLEPEQAFAAAEASGARRDGAADRRDVPVEMARRYRAAVATRPWPALMWGQRRLTSDAALDRAAYATASLPAGARRVAFLGDDDLVSPLVAALARGCEVVVYDVDPLVLDEAAVVAGALNAKVVTEQVDLRIANPVEVRADLVVADPFPSSDGSFEGFFWEVAAGWLVPEGRLLSTLAPSHKPREYAVGALTSLESLGFDVLDRASDSAHYEVFDFELAALERSFLDRLGQQPGVHHTKDTFVATWDPRRPRRPVIPLDYLAWQRGTETHYLAHFARRAGGGARILDAPSVAGSPVARDHAAPTGEPSRDDLWRLAHESWTRTTGRPESDGCA